MDYLAVAIGGAAGSVLRYAAQSAFRPHALPLGTILVNLIGSLLIGICAALAERGWPGLRPWLMAGFLGGLTTFSGFSIDALRLLRGGQPGLAAVYMGASVAAGLALAYAGYALTRALNT